MRKGLTYRSRKLVACLGIGWLSFGGCTFGPAVSHHTPATSGAGLTMVVTLKSPIAYRDSSIVSGELLTVSERGLTLRMRAAEEPLVLIPFAIIREGRSPEDNGVSIKRASITPETYERLRLQSRFPQGLSDDVLRQMLDLHGQENVSVVGGE